MASNNDGYWSRSWALLTRDKGWIKPLLVISAAQMVPVVGQLGASGYALEWGRLTAWGVDAAPKQKGVKVGECIKSGARALVVGLGYALVFGIVRVLFSKILGEGFGDLLSIVFSVLISVVMTVAMLRATVYQSIGAGYEVSRIWDMVKRDYQGLLRIIGMMVLVALGLGAIAGILMGIVMIAHMGDLIDIIVTLEGEYYVDEWKIAMMVMNWIGSILPLMLVIGYIVGVFVAGANLLEKAAVGLWMRQFDVQRWGESSDPLPDTQPGYAGGNGYGYGSPNQSGPYYGAPTSTYDAPAGTYGAPTDTYAAPSTPVPGAAPADNDRVVQSMPLSYGQPTPEQVAASQNYDASQFGGIPQAITPSVEPQASEIPQVESVPTFVLGSNPEPAAPAMPESTVETFTLDDAVTDAPAAFTLDDVAPAAPAPPATFTLDDAVAESVPTFTLDDSPAPVAPEPAVFTLDDITPEAPEEPATFTLDDAIAQSRVIVDADLTEPVDLPKKPIPMPAAETDRDDVVPPETDTAIVDQPTDEPAAPLAADELPSDDAPDDEPEA